MGESGLLSTHQGNPRAVLDWTSRQETHERRAILANISKKEVHEPREGIEPGAFLPPDELVADRDVHQLVQEHRTSDGSARGNEKPGANGCQIDRSSLPAMIVQQIARYGTRQLRGLRKVPQRIHPLKAAQRLVLPSDARTRPIPQRSARHCAISHRCACVTPRPRRQSSEHSSSQNHPRVARRSSGNIHNVRHSPHRPIERLVYQRIGGTGVS